MTTAALLALALILDALFGEPDWLWRRVPHPAVVMGRAVGWCDARFNQGAGRRLKGAIAFAGLAVAALGIGAAIAAVPDYGLLEILIAAMLLAQKSLADHVRAVASGLRLSLADGRMAVARIVGRDPEALDGPGVARGAIESAAENLSDAVVAPAFWFLLFGLPGLMLYKLTNTADSMIGYRTPRHEAFGWAAARFDDLLNWIPARATAFLIAARTGQLGAWRAIAAEARQHRSPNAGWPEAATARALGVALSGPRAYHGTVRDYLFVNPSGAHEIGAAEIDASADLLWQVWWAGLTLVLLLALLA